MVTKKKKKLTNKEHGIQWCRENQKKNYSKEKTTTGLYSWLVEFTIVEWKPSIQEYHTSSYCYL